MFSKIQLVGFLGRDSELRYTTDGKGVLNFSMAVNEKWTANDGSKKEHVEWFNCAIWGKRAEALARYLTKGKQVMVEGRPRTRIWETKDGEKRFSMDVRVGEIVLLGGGSGAAASNNDSQSQNEGADPEYYETDIPF